MRHFYRFVVIDFSLELIESVNQVQALVTLPSAGRREGNRIYSNVGRFLVFFLRGCHLVLRVIFFRGVGLLNSFEV